MEELRALSSGIRRAPVVESSRSRRRRHPRQPAGRDLLPADLSTSAVSSRWSGELHRARGVPTSAPGIRRARDVVAHAFVRRFQSGRVSRRTRLYIHRVQSRKM